MKLREPELALALSCLSLVGITLVLAYLSTFIR